MVDTKISFENLDLYILKMILAAAVSCLIPILTLSWITALLYSGIDNSIVLPSPLRLLFGLLLPLRIATHGIQTKSLSQSGGVAALVVGFLMTISSTRFMCSLLAFFIFASKATKYKSSQKKKLEADFKEGGQRNWIQVICNGGPATILALLYMLEVGSVDLPVDFKTMYSASWYSMAVLAALASSSGDTFASEIGSVIGNKDPFHLVMWKHVPRGTNGGVTLVGTLSSFFGGFIVGIAFYIAILLSISFANLDEAPPQWPVIIYATLAGGLGSLVDSLLGGSVQFSGFHTELGCIVEHSGPDVEHISGKEVFDNHSVNLLSSLITCLIIPYISAQTWPLSL